MIVQESTGCIYITRAYKPHDALAQLRASASNPADLQLFAIAFKLGRAQDLVKMKLKAFHLRYSWYSKEAYEYLESVGEQTGTFLRLERFVEGLFKEVDLVGAVEASKASAVTRDVPVETLKLTRRKPTGRPPGRPKGPERYDHPKRRVGRPRKAQPEKHQSQVDVFQSGPEKHHQDSDVFSAEPEKHRQEPPRPAPAWAQALARRASSGH